MLFTSDTPVPHLFAIGDVDSGLQSNPLARLMKFFTTPMLCAVPVLFSAPKQVEQAETGSHLTASTTSFPEKPVDDSE